jgi:Uma2 family endonuclease
MAMLTEQNLMTGEQWLALPDDGVERWLIHGQLREREITRRNWTHSEIMGWLVHLLHVWNANRPAPRGRVLCGEAGVRLRREPDSIVGVDVAYVQPELVPAPNSKSTLIEGAPLLTVEILSPSEVLEEVFEKIDLYLECGVKIVWIVNPHDRTITAYEQGKRPILFNEDQELTAEPWLPGFRAPVRQLFG